MMLPNIGHSFTNSFKHESGVVIGYAGYVNYRQQFTILGVVVHYHDGSTIHHLSEFNL